MPDVTLPTGLAHSNAAQSSRWLPSIALFSVRGAPPTTDEARLVFGA
ncbi:hypothetical protein N184_15625 [Sinorhizobium sp. GL28]|nr:hypothetical protein N184_15625 [Sinorhizobium sp. GL28]